MKVLQVGKYYYPEKGGIETVMFDITEGMNKRGISCDVLCANTTNRYELTEINGYKVHRAARAAKLLSTSISPDYVRLLKKIVGQYDIIHVHLPDPLANLALFRSNLEGKKVIVHWHSDIVNAKQMLVLPLYRPLQNWLLKRAEAIVCTTKPYMDASTELSQFVDKCVIIPIGIDVSHFQSDDDKLLAEMTHKFHGKKVVFSLGRHVYYKGFEHLIRAAALLDDNTVILIGGEGQLTPAYRLLIKELGLDNKVFLVGRIPQDQLSAYFRLCKVFCLPSNKRSEAFGVVLLEAMFYGKPIVATNIEGSGVNWVNQHGVTGLNANIEDAVSLANQITRLISDQQLYDQCAGNAQVRYQTYFTADKMVGSFIELYENH
ncbi:glycosyltransferase [Chitinophaga sp. Ak27]|uniref:glycosyltransferase n=1 Tax=Chitinophaga sp. Ak27 TaxID=2726116 RepID=UPI00145FB7F2|nr:glycosyltransferase [Chitinophaga sp. Ak27]NLU94416.1 glycosyltransferase [Chitinophaga sp. Ak27]